MQDMVTREHQEERQTPRDQEAMITNTTFTKECYTLVPSIREQVLFALGLEPDSL